jgi:hypothetical protein
VTHKGVTNPLFRDLQVLIGATSVVMPGKSLLPGSFCVDLGLQPQCSHSNFLTSRDLPYTILTTH